ncbi:glycosyl hydrolase family 43 [Salinimicrobium marinum]|uniref:Glycosyl hydrolase family 43 n=2 Tax=Salinimicrobium marinum TaxID=680283 RepID=A0A918SKL1_9FLAO|nr:glycosyl hydrolase family 43 [Salinimicrobium marinum]
MVFFLVSCSKKSEGDVSGSEVGEDTPGKDTFLNPLISNGADPWVLKHGNSYFYTHTTGGNLELRETAFMEDLENADVQEIWEPPSGEDYSFQIWAPELHFIDDKWYMYFAATSHNEDSEKVDANRRMYVIESSSESPMNTDWEFKGKISDETDYWAIDGTVLNMDEGNYFIWSGWRTTNQPENSGKQQLYIARMKNPWTLEGSRVMISEPEFDWERNGLVNEGPVVWRNPDGEIFLFYSASGCWTDEYKIGVLQLKGGNPLDADSWIKHVDPLFEKSEANSVYGPGHNSFFKSPDGTEDWVLYHANNNSGEGCGEKRKPRMQKIDWDENGFPVLGVPADTSIPMKIPSSN